MIKLRRIPFTSPPIGAVMDYFLKDSDFGSFVASISDLDAPHFDDLRSHLERVSPFLDRDSLSSNVVSILGDSDATRNIIAHLWLLSQLFREADEPFAKCVEIFKKQMLKSEKFGTTEEHRTSVALRILALTASPSGFDLQFKAQQLSVATGVGMRQCQFICDVRPVYSTDRSNIDGAIVMTTLRLNLDDETEQGIDIRLTESQLHDLVGKASIAEAKLQALKSLLEKREVVLARVSGTNDDGASQ